MGNEKEQMQVEFHNKANATFFSIYRAFEQSVSSISRRREEFKFQQLKKQYAVTMEQELQRTAKEILARFKNEKQLDEMEQIFSRFIKEYLHRFIQKVNDL
ncbi:MAG TPA: hypothetical protein VNT20_16940 [Flavisolibacter sp.]|jgi:hypothetical protein|nr:hypothetical protein [Flavisolibacter sp.]